MSNVLKKITKKYKWLRFLNRKVTKLSVLGASLVGLCISSGASFAKYRDENYGSGNAGIATIKDVKVNYIPQTIQIPSNITSSDEGYHCFIATFYVSIDQCEVACNYTLSLQIRSKTCENYGSTAAEDQAKHSSFSIYGTSSDVNNAIQNGFPHKVRTFKSTTNSNGQSTVSRVDNALTQYSIGVDTFSFNTVYYATGSSENSVVWANKEISSTSNTTTFIIDENTNVSVGSYIKYYKILYFVNFYKETNGDITVEESRFFYNLTINQGVA